MAAAVRDGAEFFDVDVGQFAGTLALASGGGTSGLAVGAAGGIDHVVLAVVAVAVGPALGGGGRGLEAFGGPSERPSVLDHAAGQGQASSGASLALAWVA